MIPDFKTYIRESFWGDVHRRSRGDEVRKEDDINLFDKERFGEYLSDLYSSIRFNLKNEYENRLCMPILVPKCNNPEGWAFNLTLHYDNPLTISLSHDFGEYYPELYKKLQEAFTVKIEKRKIISIVIYPKNGGKVTNQFYIDVLNFIIDNVENKEELIIKRN